MNSRDVKKKVIIISSLIVLVTLITLYFLMINKPIPKNITYGVSFNTLYARELGLNEREVYDAILQDLDVKHLRLAAHWDLIEPEDDKWNFSEIDYQVNRAIAEGADIILGVGRRLPRWPECHTPSWAENLEWADQKEEIKEYIETVVNRYKGYKNIIYWQVENEPFLDVFAKEHCGKLDVDFLDEEIALVKSLDDRKILVTDSGNIGTWKGAYQRGDLFGTSVYVYLWNPEVGPFKTFLPPSWYRMKQTLMEWFYGDKEVLLIELSLEPWLLQPVVETPFEIQLERMNIDKFDEIIKYAKNTRFEKQYLWGAEWWYYMKSLGYEDFWDHAKKIY